MNRAHLSGKESCRPRRQLSPHPKGSYATPLDRKALRLVGVPIPKPSPLQFHRMSTVHEQNRENLSVQFHTMGDFRWHATFLDITRLEYTDSSKSGRIEFHHNSPRHTLRR